MDTNLQIILTVIAAVIAIVVFMVVFSQKYKKSQYDRLLASYGQLDKHEFTHEEYESISHFFKNTITEKDIYIDDITWNDLDMDKIFLMINNTKSSVGCDYLYKLLRVPATTKDELAERERLIRYFEANKKERTLIMQGFDNIGFTRKISITDHTDRLLELKPESNLKHYFMIVFIIASIAFTLVVDPILGILFMLAAFGTAIVSYYKTKARIDSYFTCIRNIVAMVNASKTICELNISELSAYNDRLNSHIDRFKKITNNSWIIVSARMNSGNLSDILLEYLRMFTHIDLIKFNNVLKYLDNNKDEIYDLMSTLGYLEAMISIASFRHLLPYYCLPEFGGNKIDVKDVYHISLKEAVANSISTDRPIILTGSNASGKSTFLKSVAINAILAQSINTCPCNSYKAPFMHVMSSMALNDNLDSGDSYYIVEIKSLKRIVDAAKENKMPILCFIDEVLRGTNTVERIAASTEILKNLADNGVMCFAATHDIELTDLLKDKYNNYHFTEEVKDGNVYFSYILHEGKATSRNAIRLLEIIGYDKSIIDKAEDRANLFVEKGVWRS